MRLKLRNKRGKSTCNVNKIHRIRRAKHESKRIDRTVKKKSWKDFGYYMEQPSKSCSISDEEPML